MLATLTISINPSAEEPTPSERAINKIKNINLQTWPDRDFSWECNTFLEWVNLSRKHRFNLKPFTKREWAFRVLSHYAEATQFSPESVVKNTTPWTDLNLFKGGTNLMSYVANSIDKTKTELGKVTLYKALAYPTNNTSELTQRQAIIKELVSNTQLRSDLTETLELMRSSESIILGFWSQDSFKNMAQRFYFGSTYETEDNDSFFDSFNQNETALFAGSAYTHTVNIMNSLITIVASGALLTYGICKIADTDIPWITTQAERYHSNGSMIFAPLWEPSKANKFIHILLALACGGWCAMHIKENLEWTYGCLLVEKTLHEIMQSVATYVKGMYLLNRYIQKNPVLKKFGPFQRLAHFFTNQKNRFEKLGDLVALLDSDTIKDGPSLIAHRGIILRSFALMHTLKNHFTKALGCVGNVDMYAGLATLIAQHTDKQARYCFAQYNTAQTPHIKASRFWHPMIDADTVVPNSLTLGIDNHRSNGIITGPNEGGKSTILKSLSIALITAQSLGIAPADSFEFTPFTSIETYLNIADDIGSGNSLFKAEVLRAQELLDRTQKAQPHEFSFCVFDEVLNGTSPVEGAAAAYSIAKHIGSFPNSICLVATHFPLLTQLEQDTQTFTNYRVVVDRSPTRNISYPRKFEQGVSDQHVALDILETQGFSGDIINDARLKIVPS